MLKDGLIERLSFGVNDTRESSRVQFSTTPLLSVPLPLW